MTNFSMFESNSGGRFPSNRDAIYSSPIEFQEDRLNQTRYVFPADLDFGDAKSAMALFDLNVSLPQPVISELVQEIPPVAVEYVRGFTTALGHVLAAACVAAASGYWCIWNAGLEFPETYGLAISALERRGLLILDDQTENDDFSSTAHESNHAVKFIATLAAQRRFGWHVDEQVHFVPIGLSEKVNRAHEYADVEHALDELNGRTDDWTLSINGHVHRELCYWPELRTHIASGREYLESIQSQLTKIPPDERHSIRINDDETREIFFVGATFHAGCKMLSGSGQEIDIIESYSDCFQDSSKKKYISASNLRRLRYWERETLALSSQWGSEEQRDIIGLSVAHLVCSVLSLTAAELAKRGIPCLLLPESLRVRKADERLTKTTLRRLVKTTVFADCPIRAHL